jgi:hypothetical protein
MIGGRTLLRIDAELKTEIRLVLILAICGAAALLGGCGSSEPTATQTPLTPPRPTHTAAIGPAVVSELSMDQLVLDSPIAHVKDSNGLEFMVFKYTDNDGKVYKCVLPAAMAEGKHKPNEWISTFNVYRQPEVLAQKKVDRSDNMGDFPFISPKPKEAPQEEAEKPKSNITVPSMSTTPNQSANPPMSPGPMPGGSARPLPGRPGGPGS